MAGDRRKLAKDLGIPTENASRILIEKEKAVKQSEIRYHIKALCQLLDDIKTTDVEFSEVMSKEVVKYILSRHGSSETLEDVSMHIETITENFMERIFSERLKDDF